MANTKVFNLFGTFDPVPRADRQRDPRGGRARRRLPRSSAGRSRSARCSRSALYAKRFFDPAQEMAMFYNGYQSASAAMEKISGVLEERPSVPDPVKPVDAARTRRARSTSTTSSSPTTRARSCCRSSTCTSRRGRPSPSSGRPVPASRRSPSSWRGSTTRPAGSVKLDGVDLRDLDPKDMRRAIVMVTQEAYLFSGTVADNIALGKPGASRAEIERARQGGRRARVHHGAARRVRHRREQARRSGLGGAAPAAVVRAGVHRGPEGAHPRRGDGVARHPVGAAGAGGAARPCSPTAPP